MLFCWFVPTLFADEDGSRRIRVVIVSHVGKGKNPNTGLIEFVDALEMIAKDPGVL